MSDKKPKEYDPTAVEWNVLVDHDDIVVDACNLGIGILVRVRHFSQIDSDHDFVETTETHLLGGARMQTAEEAAKLREQEQLRKLIVPEFAGGRRRQ